MVVAGVDGSPPSIAAAEEAARSALAADLNLDLVHCYLHPFGYGSAPLDPYQLAPPPPPADGERMLADLAKLLRTAYPGVRVTHRQLFGGAPATLVAESRHAALLVVGCRGLGGFAGLLLGSVSSQVVAHAHCPVLVVRPPASGDDGAMPPTPLPGGGVVVGVDGSAPGELALLRAAEEAARRGRPLLVVHVCPDTRDRMESAERAGAGGRPPAAPTDPGLAGAAAERLLAASVEAVRRRHATLRVSGQVRYGVEPAAGLVQACAGAELVVVGARGHGGFVGLLLGSVSQAMAHHAPCPVLVVHED
jgi:nucleotide-binding universal stress UspA family protein